MEFLSKWLKNAIIGFVTVLLVFILINYISRPTAIANGDNLFRDSDFIFLIIFSILFGFIESYEPIKKFLNKPLFKSKKK